LTLLVKRWRADCFLSTGKLSLRAYHRAMRYPKTRLYLSTGIHGDEPAGPLAALELLRQYPWIDEADT
jgi:predicted deacylase